MATRTENVALPVRIPTHEITTPQQKFRQHLRKKEFEEALAILKTLDRNTDLDLPIENGCSAIFFCIGIPFVNLPLAKELLARGVSLKVRSTDGFSIIGQIAQHMDYWVGRGDADVGDELWKQGVEFYEMVKKQPDFKMEQKDIDFIRGNVHCAREELFAMMGVEEEKGAKELVEMLEKLQFKEAILFLKENEMNLNAIQVGLYPIGGFLFQAMSTDESRWDDIQELLRLMFSKGLKVEKDGFCDTMVGFSEWVGENVRVGRKISHKFLADFPVILNLLMENGGTVREETLEFCDDHLKGRSKEINKAIGKALANMKK